MRIANMAGRLALDSAGRWVDVELASRGKFAADPQAIFGQWDAFRNWAESNVSDSTKVQPAAAEGTLGPPAPTPRQVFAIGLNYRDHASETGFAQPKQPPIFTKFPSCIAGPEGNIVLPSTTVDWEVELVAVLAREAHRVPEERAWEYIAGLTAGQDLSERTVQHAGPSPQYSLGKSFSGFGPIGPHLVSPDALPNPDDLVLSTAVNGEQVQQGRTRDMIFSVAELVARLSAVCTLYPGDLIFTGTPSGVGAARNPQRFLAPGDELVSTIEGVGQMRHHCVAATGQSPEEG